MNYQQLGYKWLIGNFYYKHSYNLIDLYEYVDSVMWHRFQSVSYKEPHQGLGKILIELICERESE